MKRLYEKILRKEYKSSFDWQLRTLFHKKTAAGFTDLASFDPLNLLSDEIVQKAAIHFANQFGFGQKTSPKNLAYQKAYAKTEMKLAEHLGFESLLLLSHSHDILTHTHQALLQPMHAGIYQKCYPYTLFESSCASTEKALFTYPFGRPSDLRVQLSLWDPSKKIPKALFARAVSKEDGTPENLEELSKIATEWDAFFSVGDPVTFGLSGYEGFGAAKDNQRAIDLLWGHFYKPYGAYATFIATSREVKEYLLSRCPILQTNQLSPFLLGAIDASIDLIPKKKRERRELFSLTKSLHKKLSGSPYFTLSENHYPFLTLHFSSKHHASEVHHFLTEEGFLLPKLNVNEQETLLHIHLNSSHTPATLTQLSTLLLAYEPERSFASM